MMNVRAVRAVAIATKIAIVFVFGSVNFINLIFVL